MSHIGRGVIPLVLNRAVEIKNKAELKTTKTSAGQDTLRQRGYQAHPESAKQMVGLCHHSHISCSDTHIRGRSEKQSLGLLCSSPAHRPGGGRASSECVFDKSGWHQTKSVINVKTCHQQVITTHYQIDTVHHIPASKLFK